MKRYLAVAWCLVLLAALLPPPAAAATEVARHVFLVDGSGSMENEDDSGLLYSQGKVQRLVQDLIAVEGAFAPADEISIGIFSKTDAERGLTSPMWVYRGTVAALRRQWPTLKPILGWTDLVGAVEAGVGELKNAGGPQLLWLLTDNIDQTTDTTDSTDAFYTHLAGRNELFRIHVFPVDVGSRQGLVLYAMARDRGEKSRSTDAERLDRAAAALNASPLRPQMGDGGFLVRPLGEQGLSIEVSDFQFDGIPDEHARWEREEDGRSLSLAGFKEDEPIKGTFTVKLTSRFPALRIVSANIQAQLINLDSGDFALSGSLPQAIRPNRVSLSPGQSALYGVDLDLPPPRWTLNVFKQPAGALADEGKIRGELRLAVTEVVFAALAPEKFFHVQSIPEILGNRAKGLQLTATTPFELHVALPWWRALLLGGLLLAVLVLLLAAYRLTFGQRRRVRAYGGHLGVKEVEGLVGGRRRLVVPGFGTLRGDALGRLRFVPEAGLRQERSRTLRGRSGQVRLEDGRMFNYTLKVERSEKHRAKRRDIY